MIHQARLYPGNKYTVQVNLRNEGTGLDVTAAPTVEPEVPNFDTTLGGDEDTNDFPDCLDKHTTQDLPNSKLNDSHFRPCLPIDGPRPSACTPRNIWRPSLPPAAPASGRVSRTLDKLGSSWPSQEDELCKSRACLLDEAGVTMPYCSKQLQRDGARAGKPSDYGGSLLFPRARISQVTIHRRSYGKNVGDILERLRPRSGDVVILPCIGADWQSDLRGYVRFIHNTVEADVNVTGGTMLLRMAKFRESSLRIRKQVKIFLKTVDHRWRLKGFLHTFGYLDDPCVPSNYRTVPVRYRRQLEPNTSDLQCIPQRGDIIIRAPWKDLFSHRTDRNPSMLWWHPALELDLNDILVRTCIWNCCSTFEAFVDLHYYNGKGLKWVFLGRDETIFEPATLGYDTDTSDDEKLSPDAGPWHTVDSGERNLTPEALMAFT